MIFWENNLLTCFKSHKYIISFDMVKPSLWISVCKKIQSKAKASTTLEYVLTVSGLRNDYVDRICVGFTVLRSLSALALAGLWGRCGYVHSSKESEAQILQSGGNGRAIASVQVFSQHLEPDNLGSPLWLWARSSPFYHSFLNYYMGIIVEPAS